MAYQYNLGASIGSEDWVDPSYRATAARPVQVLTPAEQALLAQRRADIQTQQGRALPFLLIATTVGYFLLK